jgi:hypothetical protein
MSLIPQAVKEVRIDSRCSEEVDREIQVVGH